MSNHYRFIFILVLIMSLFFLKNINAGEYREINYNNGDQYKGEVKEGTNIKHGKGIYIWARGVGQYEGDWVNDSKTGYGVFTWKNGDRYAGEWMNNNMHGRGVYTYADGDRLDGYFANDKFVSKADSKQQSYPNSLAEAKQEYEEALAAYNYAVKKLNEARDLNSLYDLTSPYYDNTKNKKDKLLGKFGQRAAQITLQNAENDYEIAKERLNAARATLNSFNRR